MVEERREGREALGDEQRSEVSVEEIAAEDIVKFENLRRQVDNLMVVLQNTLHVPNLKVSENGSVIFPNEAVKARFGPAEQKALAKAGRSLRAILAADGINAVPVKWRAK